MSRRDYQRSLHVSPPLPLASRGVYVHPYQGVAGEQFAVAVDRRGRRRVEATIYHPQDADMVVGLLWDALDRVDPTHLQLIS